MSQQTDFVSALASLPAKHRAWLEDGDMELWAYYGLGVLLNDAQLEHINDVLTWPPGSYHVWRWANRTGKTTGLDVLHGWAAWYKWRYEAPIFDEWFGYQWKSLHAAPLGELAGKAYELWEQILKGTADQQRDRVNQRQRPALLAPFFTASKSVDVTGVDRPVVECANNAKIDFRSTQGKAARLESDSWWLISWDEFPRQLPTDDIPIILDQTMLPRSSDYMAPVILAGTDTTEAEYIYAELEEISANNPADWNFTASARSRNFAMSKASIDRQRRMSIDKDIASRSLDGSSGGGSSSMFPGFLLSNAFRDDLPEHDPPPATDDESGWARRGQYRTFLTALDHALAHDDNVLMTLDVPWPPSRISVTDPIIGSHIQLFRGSRTLTGDEQHAYLDAEYRAYRSKATIIDSTGPGGLSVYRKARAEGLPAVDCNLQGRAAKWVTNKEYALQGLQRMLSYGLPIDTAEGFISEWPEASGPFGLFRFPNHGPWLKLRRQLGVYRRLDEKLRQDAAMTLAMHAWYLWRLIGHASKPKSQQFNIVATRHRDKAFARSRR